MSLADVVPHFGLLGALGQHLRWIDRRLHVVHDWDSAVTQAKAAIAGQAAAVWPGTGLPGEVATVAQSEQFLTAYERASGHSWTDCELRAAWAAGCGPAPSTPRRPASSARIPPPHSPRLKLSNGHGSPDCDHARLLQEIGSRSNPPCEA